MTFQEEFARKDADRPGSDWEKNPDAIRLHQNLIWAIKELERLRIRLADLQTGKLPMVNLDHDELIVSREYFAKLMALQMVATEVITEYTVSSSTPPNKVRAWFERIAKFVPTTK